MKKTSLIAAAMLVAATTAHAEHKLLPTDVVNFKGIEGRVDFGYTVKEEKGAKDAYERDMKAELGIGVIKGGEVKIKLPYTIENEGVKEKFTDLSVEAKYSLNTLFALPANVTVGSEFKLNSSNNDAAGRTYSPFIAVSKNYHAVTPYAVYQADIVKGSAANTDTHSLKAGAELELKKNLSIDASVAGAYEKDAETLDKTVELAVNYEFAKNLYLIPSVSAELKEDKGAVKDAREYHMGVGIYYNF